MGLKIGGKIERVDGKELSCKEFVERYLKRNQPVLLTGLMGGWRACKEWVTEDGLPNLHFFSAHFGNSIVQVADCSRRQFTDQKRTEMSISDFISYWLDLSAGSYGSVSSCDRDARRLLYLKDWHFVKEYPGYAAYTTPEFFSDDWLNLYLDSYFMHKDPDIQHDRSEINCSDYRFVYMGPKGTWTPLHADVFRSYSWSANVCGKKLWYFLPPSQCHLLFDRNLRNSVYDIFDDVSERQFPGFKKTIWWECTQEQDEIIFVPSGWYHQVHNLEDAVSINHNWFNGYNLSFVWNLLSKDYNEAKDYIEDIRDICDNFEGLCQRNLAANTGMNFYDFLIFITRFSMANLILLYHLKNVEKPIFYSSSKVEHLEYNLTAISEVASNMKSADAFAEENIHRSLGESHWAFSGIGKILEECEFPELCTALSRTLGLIDELHEQDSKVKNTSVCAEGCLSCPSKTGFGKSDFVRAFDPKFCGPGDLVRLIGSAFMNPREHM